MSEYARSVILSDSTTRALLDCVDDAILVVSPQLDVRYANRAALMFTAAADGSITPLQGMAAHLIHPDDIVLALDALDSAVADQFAKVRLRLNLPGGEKPVEVSLTNHIGTDGVDGIVACFRDLGHEEALRKSIERQQQLDLHVQAALTDELTGLPNRRLFLERLAAVAPPVGRSRRGVLRRPRRLQGHQRRARPHRRRRDAALHDDAPAEHLPHARPVGPHRW